MIRLDALLASAEEVESKMVDSAFTSDDLLVEDSRLGIEFGDVPELEDVVESLWSQYNNRHDEHVSHIENNMFEDHEDA